METNDRLHALDALRAFALFLGICLTMIPTETAAPLIDDGVVVNERFETGAPGVYAAGDVARFYDPLFERHRRIEHWSNANYQGTKVGERIAGVEAHFDIVSAFFTEVFGITLKVFGDVDHFDEIVFRGRVDDEKAIGFYLQGPRLVATLVVGQDEETENKLKELIAARATAPDLERVGNEDASLDEAFVTTKDVADA